MPIYNSLYALFNNLKDAKIKILTALGFDPYDDFLDVFPDD